MKDIYELYKNSLHGYKKSELEGIDKIIDEISAIFAEEEWFLVNGGFEGIEYIDGNDSCKLPFIKNIGLYPIRKNKEKPTYGEMQALVFYVRHKNNIDKLSEALIKKHKMINTSLKESVGIEKEMAQMLLTKEPKEKIVQKVK